VLVRFAVGAGFGEDDALPPLEQSFGVQGYLPVLLASKLFRLCPPLLASG